MSKLEYITRCLQKCSRKRFELYVISRIWNILNDTSIHIVCQQYVALADRYALTDLYFPQFQIHLEIDEQHHLHHEQVIDDQIRQYDIIAATNHDFYRIDVGEDLDQINARIDEFVTLIKQRKENAVNFIEWTGQIGSTPENVIQAGNICVDDGCFFSKKREVMQCFGRIMGGVQQGAVRHPFVNGVDIWFPKLYPNDRWYNEMSVDESTITEIQLGNNNGNQHAAEVHDRGVFTRVVFARVETPLRDIVYRFMGVYVLDLASLQYPDNGLLWQRTSTRVNLNPNYATL